MGSSDSQVLPEETVDAQAAPEPTDVTSQVSPEGKAKTIFKIGAYLAYGLKICDCALEETATAAEFANWMREENPVAEGARMTIAWKADESGKVKLYSQNSSGSFSFTLMEGLNADHACIPFCMSADIDEKTRARALFVWYPVEGKMSGADVTALDKLGRDHPLVVKIREALYYAPDLLNILKDSDESGSDELYNLFKS